MRDAEIAQAAESLRRLLDAIESGELAASGDEQARLEGALIVLLSLLVPDDRT